MTSWWARDGCLESLASRLFTQTFGQTQITENIKAPRWPVNSPHKGPVTRKMFPFDAVIIYYLITWLASKIALNVPNTCLATFTPHIRNYNDGYYGKPSYLLILEFNVMKVARSLARSKSTQYIHQNKSWPCVTQALTTPRKIRLPIGQPAGKSQVAPIKVRLPLFAEPYCKE